MDNKLNHTVAGPRDSSGPFLRGVTQRNTIGHPTSRPHTSTTNQRTTVGSAHQHQGGRVAMTLDSDFRRLNMTTADQGDDSSKKGMTHRGMNHRVQCW